MKRTPSIMMRLCSAGNCFIFVLNSINILPSIRCYCSKDDSPVCITNGQKSHKSVNDNEFYSSLSQLVDDIDVSYHIFSNLFPGLTVDMVSSIKKSIKDRRYTLSPLLVETFTRDVVYPNRNYLRFTIHGDPDHYMVVKPTVEDSLVLLGLSRMLTLQFHKVYFFIDKSFSLTINEYSRSICKRGNVIKLYKFDLFKSFITINRCSVMHGLLNVVKVKDPAIIDLVSKFLDLPLKNECGMDFTPNIRYTIPPIGVLTNVLLDFTLTMFDEEFSKVFPGLEYSRYLNEVIVTFPCTDSSKKTLELESEEEFEDTVFSLFDYLHVEGEILSIGPGDPPLLCYGGLVSVCQDGQIQLIESNIGKER